MRKVFLLAFALFAWNILANAQESDERYIEVTGSSEIEVVPDEIHFLIHIQTLCQFCWVSSQQKSESSKYIKSSFVPYPACFSKIPCK